MEEARQHPALSPAPARALAVAAALALAGGAARAADPAPIAVPSGQPVTFLDTVQGAPGPDGLTVRFRFVAPQIAREGGSIGAEQALSDMQALCDGYALPRLPRGGPVPAQVIISLADRPVAFGEPDPDATQYFEAYAVADGTCQRQDF